MAAVFGWPKEYFAHLQGACDGMDGVVNEMETLAWAAMLTGILIGVGVGKAKETQRNQQKMEGFKMTYEELGKEIGALVDRKQQQYGNSFGQAGKVLKVLYPNGVKPEEYGDMLGVVRVVDKLFRVANGNQGEEDAWQDIAGYGLLGAERNRKKEEEIKFYD